MKKLLKSPLPVVAGLLLVWAVGLRAESGFTVSSDHPDGIYAAGEKAVFTVGHSDDGPALPAGDISIRRDYWSVLETATLGADTAQTTIDYTPPENGWYVCAVTPAGEAKPITASGVVFDPDAFAPYQPEPADFDAFWAAQKARLAAQQAEPVFTPLTPEQLEIETKGNDKVVVAFQEAGGTFNNVEIPCLDYRPVRGYYVVPPHAEGAKLPVIVTYHAAGVSGAWCRANLIASIQRAKQFNAIVLDMNAHGMLNGQPQAYYDDLAKGELADYSHQGNESRESYYMLGMVLRLVRGLDFVCAQPEWDGRRLLCMGTSQGGAQALIAAGIDSRVSAAVGQVPAMCGIGGSPAGWPKLGKYKLGAPEAAPVVEAMSYYDAIYFSARSQAETFIGVGLIDTTCPPPGVYAAYNQIKQAKQIVPAPDGTHHSAPNTPDVKKESAAFIKAHLAN